MDVIRPIGEKGTKAILSIVKGVEERLSTIEEEGGGYTHPSYPERASGLYKVTVDALGHVSDATAVEKADISALGIPEQDTTYGEATTETAGLMSAADKAKLDGLPDDGSVILPTTAGTVVGSIWLE